MIYDLKSIDQTGIKALIKERIENPSKYVNMPLIIWRSNIEDGIQRRILEEVFDGYNMGKSMNDRKWYRRTSLENLNYAFTEPTIIRSDVGFHNPAYGKYDIGLMVIDTIFAYGDYKRGLGLDMYYSAINSRCVGNVKMLSGVPVVAYMCSFGDWFETPEAYPNAEQYVFEPNFEEWENWAIEQRKFPKLIIDFIRGDGDKDGIITRWYNYSTAPDATFCFPVTPERWNIVWTKLRVIMHEMNVDSVMDLDESDVKSAICGCVSTQLLAEFCKYFAERKQNRQQRNADEALNHYMKK